MLKVCSLDYLNKEVFGTTIFASNGAVLCAANDKVTPELLLKLYFKELFIDEKTVTVHGSPKENITNTSTPVNNSTISNTAISSTAASNTTSNTNTIRATETTNTNESNMSRSKMVASNITPSNAIESETVEIKQKKLLFDEERAKKVAKYSVELAKLIGGYGESELAELELAAYNHKIGGINFTEDHLIHKDIRNMIAEVGYQYLLKEKKYPDKVAEVTKLYMDKYDCNRFDINKIDLKVPFYHIVAITSYYDEYLAKTLSKDETIKKMLRLGHKRFNPYVLHKFVNYMRNNNG